MSARGTRTLARLFQATLKAKPEKRCSAIVEDANPVHLEKSFAFEPDFWAERERVLYYYTRFVFKEGESIDMDLVDEKRRLLFSGRLYRHPESAFERRAQSEILVLLFDNYLVMVKPIGKRLDKKFHVYKRPIPLELLGIEPCGDVPVRVRRGSSFFLGRDDADSPHTSTLGAHATEDHSGTFPFTIAHGGRLGGFHTLYADTDEIRSLWRTKLEEAIQLRKQSNKFFKAKILNRESFLMKTGTSSGYLPEGRELTRTINCATPFTTRDGRDLLAVGCVEGLWVGDIRDSLSFHRVLPLQTIRQCAVLEELGIILILADKDLCAYDLESCVPTSTDPKAYHPPQKLNPKGDVSFFRVGVIAGETYVVFWRTKRTETLFRMLRVVRPVEQEAVVMSPNAKSEWFHVDRDFILPMPCTDVIFLRRNLVILHRNGFNMLNLPDSRCVEMPLPAGPCAQHKNLIKRCTSSQSLGMFRLRAETFLLCYDKFGIFVDKHGTLISGSVAVEWEGVAERASYLHPFVLLFSSGFLEIRHAASGQLEQVIRGDSMRCIWEGDNHLGEDPDVAMPSEDLSVLGISNTAAGLDELAVQCIFTLVPSKLSPSPIQTQLSIATTEPADAR